MKLSLGSEVLAPSCALELAKNVRVDVDPALSVSRETLLYAVCRFIRHSPALCREYVIASWRLRLQSGRARRALRRGFVSPAALLELPRGWAAVSVSVSPAGVTVERVGLYPSFDRAQAAVRPF